MTLDEAIKELDHWQQLPWDASHKKLKDAVKLGIEALKFIRARRGIYNAQGIMTLPGETKQ